MIIYMNLIIIFFLNLFTSTLSQLKYMFANRPKSWQMYLIVFIDSIFYLYSLKLVMNDDNSIVGITVLTLGKLLGITLANLLEEKSIKRIYSYNIYLTNLKEVNEIEEIAFAENISITTIEGKHKNLKRFIVNVHATQQQIDLIFKKLKAMGIENPTADASEVSKVFGHIKKRIK